MLQVAPAHLVYLPCVGFPPTHHSWTGATVSKFCSWSTWGHGKETGTLESLILRNRKCLFFPGSLSSLGLGAPCGSAVTLGSQAGPERDYWNSHQRAVVPHTRLLGPACLCVSDSAGLLGEERRREGKREEGEGLCVLLCMFLIRVFV